MAEYKSTDVFDEIEIVGEAIEIDLEEPSCYTAPVKSSNRKDSTNTWKLQENATSIVNNTVSSVTAAFGKQIESLSKQSTFDYYDFAGKQETPTNTMSETEPGKFLDVDASSGSKSAVSLPLEGRSSILHDKLYEKNITVRKEIDCLVNNSCGAIPTKLQGLLTDLSKTQLYFQESVISMQQAKANSNDIILCLDKLDQTSKTTRFPSLN